MDNVSPAATSEQPTPPSGPPPSGPRVSRDEMKDLGRLRRSVTDRHVAGVAGGIARHLDIDAIIVRVALVVGVFFGGAGLLLYVCGYGSLLCAITVDSYIKEWRHADAAWIKTEKIGRVDS